MRTDTPGATPPRACGAGGLPVDFAKASGRVPADVAAAESAVIEVVQMVDGGAGAAGSDALAHIEDGEKLREVVDVAAERFPQYARRISAQIEGVRFVDADEAAVKSSLSAGDVAPSLLPAGVGTVVLRDGTWLLARGTFCALLAVGGVYCPYEKPATSPD